MITVLQSTDGLILFKYSFIIIIIIIIIISTSFTYLPNGYYTFLFSIFHLNNHSDLKGAISREVF